MIMTSGPEYIAERSVWCEEGMKVQWRRSVAKSGGQGQLVQAIKLFQITPYVNPVPDSL